MIQYQYSDCNKNDLMSAWTVLADKQYHTYQLPSEELMEKIYQWIVSNWAEDIIFLSGTSTLIGNFAILKGLKLFKAKIKNCLDDKVRTEMIETA